MSSLTSPSVNKNTTRFAPKVKQRERRGSSLKTSVPIPTLRSTMSTSLLSTKDFKHPESTLKTIGTQDTTLVSGLSTAPPSSSVPVMDTSPLVIRSKEPLTTETPAISSKLTTLSPPSTKRRRSSANQSTTFSAPTKGEHAVGVASSEPSPPRATPTPITHDANILTEADSGTNQPTRTNRRKRLASDTVEPLVTLDDITHDPATTDLIQKPLSYFIDDQGKGIVSKSFKDMKMKNSAPQAVAHVREDPPTEPITAPEPPSVQESSTAPQLRLVNGEIVLDTSSLYIETQPRKQTDYEVVEEDSMTKKINSRTHGKQHNSFGKRWSQKETDMFYRGLQMYGTDFEMIALVIPSRTRKEVKYMFNRQEKLHPAKITESIMQRLDSDPSSLTGTHN